MDVGPHEYQPLPIIVGVTGHRDIPHECVGKVEKRVESQLLLLQKQYPHCPVTVLSSLADGADRLCARAALNTGCRLRVPLPMPQEEYEKDFDETSRHDFGDLLSRADEVFVVGALEQPPAGDIPRGYFYRQAGLYVAKHAHVLIALWDGTELLYPEGGGTYETVCCMQQEDGIISHIPTPRMSGPESPLPAVDAWTCEDKRLASMDRLNGEIERRKLKLDGSAAEIKKHVIDADIEQNLSGGLSRLLNVFLYADALSVKYRNLKLTTLRLLSVLGLLLVLSFLLYDEMESDLMLFVYGAVIIAAAVIYVISARLGYHGKYISYRVLAEALRVQFYWTLGGITENACGQYTYTQKSELDFVRFIMRAIGASDSKLNGTTAPNRNCVYRYWLQGQHDYHTVSAVKKGNQNCHNVSAAKIMLIASVFLFAVVTVMELFFKVRAQEPVPVSDALRNILMMHGDQAVIWRGVLKIALGIVSAGTAFLANYYGSLSLPQQIFDNQRMRMLFSSSLRSDPSDETGFGETLRMVGRESLIESGSWYILQRDNAQKLFI